MWVSPTSHTGTPCLDPEQSYDNDESTMAWFQDIGVGAWSDYLILIPGMVIDCNKIRMFLASPPIGAHTVDVDVYYDGGWNDVFSGAITEAAWAEYDMAAGRKTVSQARVRFYNDEGVTADAYFYEFQFNAMQGFVG